MSISRRRAWFTAITAAAALSCEAAIDIQEQDIVELVGFYDPCGISEQCPLPAFCDPISVDYGSVIVEDALCTVECLDDFDCPAGGVCVDALGGLPLCFQPCLSDLECPAGFACVAEAFGSPFATICLPF